MADSNKVFVSPGIYTSEKDLTFVAQSVGVSTLGLAGETLKGPAFEPILIKNFDEFRVYFGTTSPEKDNAGTPKYQLPYVAKSYLQESNQLFVTRILGLTGYRADKTFSIQTLGTIVYNPGIYTQSPQNVQITSLSTTFPILAGKKSTNGDGVIDFITGLTMTVGQWFTIGLVPTSGTTSLTGTSVTGPIGDDTSFAWSNLYYTSSASTVDSFLFVKGTGTTFNVTNYKYQNALPNSYENITVAALRSRGSYSNEILTLQVSTTPKITSSTLLNNPLGEFTLNVTGLTGNKTFTCSLDSSSTKYINKVIGVDVFDKDENNFPLYAFETYPNLVSTLTDRGLIRGLSTSLVVYNHNESASNPDFMTGWDTPESPMVVSEVRGGEVSDLFEVITISDGEDANQQVKIMISNINLENGEFDLLVRDFNDTDDNQVVLEKYSRCSMNPELPGYVGLKIGTHNGDYELKSKYIMLSMADNHPVDAVPAGFRGFTGKYLNGSTSSLGNVIYKTDYYDAGDIVTYTLDGVGIQESGDKVKRVSLGLSTSIGFDADMLKFKGLKNNTKSHGFHLSVNAANITGVTFDGKEFQTTPYDFEGSSKGKLEELSYRKFTFGVCGGYDGWDIYRNVRTNTDGYIYGKTKYISGNTTYGGVFSTTAGNSDYYAYLQGIQTFSNPESININIFATPGINFYDHASLVEQTIDMVENDRADSLYIIDAPNVSTSDEVIDLLDTANIDSNYSTTYWPWIQIRDNENSAQLYLPPTGEVVRNLALTDNVSYPWFATAGYSRGLVNSIKAYKKLTLDERDELYKNRINPIATFADTGTIIWGNKTLQVRESALDRINVRRLLLRARKLISAVAVRLLFEQNDELVRNEFLRLTSPILESIKKERGLYDFRVTVSNDPEDYDSNTLRGKIYIKPSRSLEFVQLDFIITPTGASFENV